MLRVLIRVPNASGGSKVFSVECLPNDIVWNLKISIFSLLSILPSKQSMFLPIDTKELEVCFQNFTNFFFHKIDNLKTGKFK